MSSDSPVPVNPDFAPERQRERAKDYQLEAIAQMSTLGTPPGTIAAVTGLSEKYVNRLLSGKGGEKFNQLREDYKRKNLKTVIGAHFELADLIPDSLDAFRAALSGPDLRLRKETGQMIWDKVVPDLNGKNGHGDSDVFQITINQPHIQTAIGESMANVAHSLAGLREAVQNQDPNQHLKIGVDALPTPPSQLEVSVGEADLEPTEDPKSDLLTELMDRVDD